MKMKCLNVVSLDLKDFVKDIHLNILNTRIAHAQVWFSNRRARLRKTLGSAAASFGSTTSPTSYPSGKKQNQKYTTLLKKIATANPRYPSGKKQTQNTQPYSKNTTLFYFRELLPIALWLPVGKLDGQLSLPQLPQLPPGILKN